MKITRVKDRNGHDTHQGSVFPGAEDRQFAYQGEQGVRTSIAIECHPPYRNGGRENWALEDSKYSHYELVFERHTSSTISVKLIGHRTDIVEQRRANGRAIMRDVLITGLQFGELVNRIFQTADIIEEKEAFPKSVEESMRHAYD
jgi:hypothetical protein